MRGKKLVYLHGLNIAKVSYVPERRIRSHSSWLQAMGGRATPPPRPEMQSDVSSFLTVHLVELSWLLLGKVLGATMPRGPCTES